MDKSSSERQLLNLLIKNNLTSWRKSVTEISEAELASLLKDNKRMQQAIAKALAVPDLWEEMVQTILDMFVFIFRHNLKKDWAGWIESALKEAPDTRSELYCRLLGRHGQLRRMLDGQANVERALEIHKQALELAQALDSQILEGLIYFQLSVDYRHYKDTDEAIRTGKLAVTTLSQEKNAPVPYLASANGTLGLAYMDARELDKAKYFMDQAITLFEQNENWFEYGLHLTNLGVIYQREGNLSASLDAYRKAEQILVDVQATFNLLFTYVNMGSIYYQLQQYEAAKEVFLKMDTPYMLQNRHIWHLAMKTHGLGDVTHMLGEPEHALPYLTEAVRHWRTLSEPLRLAYTLATREAVHLDLGNVSDAESDYLEATKYIAANPNHGDAAAAQFVLDKWQQRRANWPYGKSGL